MSVYNELVTKTAGEWLEEQFLRWQLESGTRKTITEFAERLGVTQPFASQVMGGKKQPSPETAVDWALITGDYEILDIMGIARLEAEKEKRAREMRARYNAVPPEDVKDFFDWVDRFLEERGYRRRDDIRPSNRDKSP